MYIPRWRLGLPLAIDFAITSGLRPDVAHASAADPSAALAAYEDFKRNHLDTARLCAEASLSFAPAIQEADGGAWGPEAQKVFSELAHCKSQITGEPKDTLLHQLLQSLGVSLHRDNARAIVKRANSFTHNVAAELLVAATALEVAAADAASATDS